MVREETLKIIEKTPDTAFVVEKLRGVLAPYKKEVKFAFLFGSYARGEADHWSDVDVGIYFDEKAEQSRRDEIRLALMSALDPLETRVAFLDSEDMAPGIFLAATDGIVLAMNDEDAYFEALMKNIHKKEEWTLLGLSAED